MCKDIKDAFLPTEGREGIKVEGRIYDCIEAYNEKAINLKPVYDYVWDMVKRSGREIHLWIDYLRSVRNIRNYLKASNTGTDCSFFYAIPIRGWVNTIYDNSHFDLKAGATKKDLEAFKRSCLEIIRVDISIDANGMAAVSCNTVWDIFTI